MREMKDSGVKWIGETPVTWNVKKLKYATTQRNTTGQYNPEYDRYIGLENVKGFSDTYIETESSYESAVYDVCLEGDVMFSKLRPYLGKVLTAPFNGYCTGEFLVFNSFDGFKPYLKYTLMSKPFIDYVNMSTYGSKMPRANSDFILNMKMPIPPVDEQRRIAEFLDARCAELDELTAAIEREIATLGEYRRSVITESVTRGLDPAAPLKDSGVAWCPQIPKHWKTSNPKALFSLRNQRAFPGERQLTASQRHGIVYQDEFIAMENQNIVTVIKDFSILKHVEPNDFVISMRSFQGGLEYSDKRGSISSAYVMLIPNDELVYPPFFRWFFKSSKYINAIQSTTNLVRDGQAMRYANFVMVPLFIIPLDEQQQIAEYLDAKCAEIDAIIAIKQQQLARLAEYKKSIIYEYVTGKREVR